jgi:hypothetical protein
MSGSAVVEAAAVPTSYGIWLETNAKITITGALSPGSNTNYQAAHSGTPATHSGDIKPRTASTGLQVLDGALITANKDKFTVNGAPGTIDNDGKIP